MRIRAVDKSIFFISCLFKISIYYHLFIWSIFYFSHFIFSHFLFYFSLFLFVSPVNWLKHFHQSNASALVTVIQNAFALRLFYCIQRLSVSLDNSSAYQHLFLILYIVSELLNFRGNSYKAISQTWWNLEPSTYKYFPDSIIFFSSSIWYFTFFSLPRPHSMGCKESFYLWQSQSFKFI